MKQNLEPRPLLTIPEVARRVNFKPRAVLAWLQKGQLEGIKIGGEWRVDPETLERFIEDRKRKS